MRRVRGIVILAAVVATACSRAPEPRRYEVRGQILSVDLQRQEVLVDHENIKGFMPAMTMPYKVRDGTLLEGKKPEEAVNYGAAHGALAMTTPGDTSTVNVKDVERVMRGGTARVDR